MDEKKLNHRYLILAALGLLVLAGAFHALMYSPLIIDDAYITFRYADNLAAGHGLSYNPPEQLEGYSNFLLLLILALGVMGGISAPLLSQVIGIISFLSLLILLFRFEEEQNGQGWFALVSPALIAFSVSCAYWSVSGLETMLYTLFITSAVYLTSIESLTKKQEILLLAMMAGIVTIRTEGALFAFVIAVAYLFNNVPHKIFFNLRKEKKQLKNYLFPLALVGAVVVASILFHGFRLAWFGTLSSGPSIAKLAGSINPLTEGVRYTGNFIIVYIPVVMIMGLVFSLTSPGKTTLPLIGIVCSQFVVSLVIGGDWMLLYRLYVPLMPLLAIETSRMIRHLLSFDNRLKIPVAVVIIVSLFKLASPPHKALIQIDRYIVTNDFVKTIAKDLKSIYGDNHSLLIGDIGIIGYKTGYEIIDMKGLVSPWICSTFRTEKEGEHLRTTLDTNALLDRAPQLILLGIWDISLSKTDFKIVNGSKVFNLSQARGFWSCDTSLLENKRLQKEYSLVKHYRGKEIQRLNYLLFQRK